MKAKTADTINIFGKYDVTLEADGQRTLEEDGQLVCGCDVPAEICPKNDLAQKAVGLFTRETQARIICSHLVPSVDESTD